MAWLCVVVTVTADDIDLFFAWRCCINRANPLTFTRNARRSAPYQVKFQSNCLISQRKCART
ncbi:MAG: hypothetical protein V3Q69_05180 [Burkholderia sp.]